VGHSEYSVLASLSAALGSFLSIQTDLVLLNVSANFLRVDSAKLKSIYTRSVLEAINFKVVLLTY
jgi:hypothetical protein